MIKWGMIPNINTPLSKQCEFCRKSFFKQETTKLSNWVKYRFCSRSCSSKHKMAERNRKGFRPWNTGIKPDRTKYPRMGHFGPRTEKEKEHLKNAHRKWLESLSPRKLKEWQQRLKMLPWLGDKATYNSKHRWIQKHWQKTGKCEICSIVPVQTGRNRVTYWANLDGKYNRDDKSTWMEMCAKCHKRYDQPESKEQKIIDKIRQIRKKYDRRQAT